VQSKCPILRRERSVLTLNNMRIRKLICYMPLLHADLLTHCRIILEFKLINWKYMNFTLKVKESTNIFSIKNILRDRHGRMDDLKICFKSFTEANEVKDDMLTLAGIKRFYFLPSLLSSFFSLFLFSLFRKLFCLSFHIRVWTKGGSSEGDFGYSNWENSEG
jgi:hypothetical protein